MFSINIDPKWVLERIGIQNADAELVELCTLLVSQVKNAPDKKAYLKSALRKALGIAR